MGEEDTPLPAGGAPEPAESTDAEVLRLRAEVAELRARAGTAQRRRLRLLTARRIIAAVLIALVAVLSVTSVVGVWGARTTFDTDRWVATVGPLPKDPAVNTAVSSYLADQIYDRLNVEQRLAQSLPPKASFLAGPASDQVHTLLRTSLSRLLATERFQSLWRAANRFTQERIVAVLENRSEGVTVQGGTVTLNLLPLVNNALNALQEQLPTLFGKKIDLPTLTSGEVPPGLHDRIQQALGVSLPQDFGQITLYNRHRLGQLQDAVLLFKRALVGLLIAVVVLLGVALWVSPGRRRTLLQLGLWLIVSVTVLSSVLRAVRGELLGQVPAGIYRDGMRAAMSIVFTTLRDRGDQLLWLGIALAVIAYLVGPGRLPKWLRRQAGSGLRWAGARGSRIGDRLFREHGLRPWLSRHADVLRVGGAVLAALIALLLSSWTSLIVIAVLLACYEIAITAAGGRRPSPPAGEVPTEAAAETDVPTGQGR
ncbi:hypothetical protein [Phaeacidiphilus oryzae]|uniref:hypothetical protein n=1 Tax=Phaeacidiphilus oryzae TaxID=348818 RepID=UPI0006910540|nr:hypothetical protein [Phaeacidiphilus oryzae]